MQAEARKSKEQKAESRKLTVKRRDKPQRRDERRGGRKGTDGG